MAPLSHTQAATLHRVVNPAIEVGYIKKPTDWGGSGPELWPVAKDANFSCDRRNVLKGAVYALFSSGITCAFAYQSAQSAMQAHYDLAELEKGGQPLEAYEAHSEDSPSPRYVPFSEELTEDVKTVLEWHRLERGSVAISQATLCAGSTLLSLALMAMLVAKTSFLLLSFCTFTGIALTGVGGLLYGASYLYHAQSAPQDAAQRISSAIYP